jgi:hypothetical protein
VGRGVSGKGRVDRRVLSHTIERREAAQVKGTLLAPAQARALLRPLQLERAPLRV